MLKYILNGNINSFTKYDIEEDKSILEELELEDIYLLNNANIIDISDNKNENIFNNNNNTLVKIYWIRYKNNSCFFDSFST